MNLLGKIFTFAILFTAIVVMVVAVAVYGTHTNWQTAYDKLRDDLTAAEAAQTELTTKYDEQISQLKAENTAALQDVSKLETERNNLLAQNASLERERNELAVQEREAQAVVMATEDNNRRLTEEVTGLRNLILEHQQARDAAFQTTLKATTDLHTTAGQLASLQERNTQITQQLAQATSAAIEGGAEDNGEVIPRVRGKVAATRRSDGAQLIEITVGADDGIKPGHTIEVFRGERYLGRAQVLRADPDRAVARILREFQQGPIQKDDDVATKLRS
jgi:predicted  nucleic acid-binding Zn-ribbon protein